VRKPNLFIVGAPKCGTTSLWTYLREHPQVFMSAEKELYFFSTDPSSAHHNAPSVQAYLEHFSAARDEKKSAKRLLITSIPKSQQRRSKRSVPQPRLSSC